MPKMPKIPKEHKEFFPQSKSDRKRKAIEVKEFKEFEYYPWITPKMDENIGEDENIDEQDKQNNGFEFTKVCRFSFLFLRLWVGFGVYRKQIREGEKEHAG